MQAVYELEILAAAQKELAEIAQRHMLIVGPASARQITNRIYKALERLRIFPDMGVICKDKELRLQNFRQLICDKYLCLYRLVNDTVFIYHIADGKTNYPVLFSENSR